MLSGSFFPAVQRSTQKTSRKKWSKSQDDSKRNVSKGTMAVSQKGERAWQLECCVATGSEEIASVWLFSGKQGCACILCMGRLHTRLCTRLSEGKRLFFLKFSPSRSHPKESSSSKYQFKRVMWKKNNGKKACIWMQCKNFIFCVVRLRALAQGKPLFLPLPDATATIAELA